MSLAPCTRLFLIAISAAKVWLVGQTVLAQIPEEKSGTRPATPSSIVISKCPVTVMRQLLTMNPQEQEKFLANKSEADREEILAKVSEYKAMRPDERELKLKATELRWYLRPFLNSPQTNRAALLANVPTKDRKLVEDRLRYWDKLPPEAKKQVQTNEAMVVYFSLPPVERIFWFATNTVMLEEGIQKLQAMPEEQRQSTLDGFSQVLAFTSTEKNRIIHTLSEPERQQIQKILKQYENMPAPQREACVHSFEKFASMSLEERQQFLQNAERWRMMTPTQRQQWKDLVEALNAMPPSPADLPPIPIAQ
jgi:hypothetical protein